MSVENVAGAIGVWHELRQMQLILYAGRVQKAEILAGRATSCAKQVVAPASWNDLAPQAIPGAGSFDHDANRCPRRDCRCGDRLCSPSAGPLPADVVAGDVVLPGRS